VDFPENMGPVMISIRPTSGWSSRSPLNAVPSPRQAEATMARRDDGGIDLAIIVVGFDAPIALLPKLRWQI